MKVTILFIICAGTVISEFYPELKDKGWKHAAVKDIKCPRYLKKLPIGGQQVGAFGIFKPDLNTELTHNGHFCHVGIWSTRCSTGLFGGRTIDHFISGSTPEESKCLEAIKSYKRGSLVNKGFPPPNCGWMSTNTEVEEVITIKEHAVHYDPVLDTFMDVLFSPTKCYDSQCTTTHSDTRWVRDGGKPQYCFHSRTGRLALYHDGRVFSIDSDDLHSNDLTRACLMTYCEKEGILLESGEWFATLDQSQYIKQLKSTMKPCTTNAVVKEDIGASYAVEKELTKSLASIHRDRCEIVVKKFALNHTMTRLDLQALTPVNPGLNNVYRFGDKGIEVSLGVYKEALNITVHQPDMVLGVSFKDGSNTSTWMNRKGDVFDGPNGIFWYGGNLYTTETAIDTTLQSAQSLETLDVIHAEHPFIDHFKKSSGGLNVTILQKSVSKSLGEVIEGGQTSIKHIFFEVVFWGLLALLLLWIIKFLISRVFCTTPAQHPAIKAWDPQVQFIR